jgi:dimethylargininase
MIQHALVRAPGPDADDGLTEQSGPPLCPKQLLQQHAAYCDMLRALEVDLLHLDPQPGFPDAYFVEDTAVVTPETAIVSRPGALQRRGEEETVARVLEQYRHLRTIDPPGTLDGGDVMIVDRQVFVGLSDRTNPSGAGQLARILTPFGYRITAVAVDTGLHLKSSVSSVGDNRLLITASWATRPEFAGYRKLLVEPSEHHACNVLAIKGHLIMPAGFPRTRALLETLGQPVLTLETSQIQRMDGGLTCLSIRF